MNLLMYYYVRQSGLGEEDMEELLQKVISEAGSDMLTGMNDDDNR